jgi:hypothetical protein
MAHSVRSADTEFGRTLGLPTDARRTGDEAIPARERSAAQ